MKKKKPSNNIRQQREIGILIEINILNKTKEKKLKKK